MNSQTISVKSIRQLRKARDSIKNEVINRVNSMGLNVPRLWKDELFRNELAKLDIKQELDKDETLRE